MPILHPNKGGILKNVKANHEINTSFVEKTTQADDNFWTIITDENYEYDLCSVPCGLIRRHKTTGEISIIFTDREIKNGKYDRVSYSLYKNSFRPTWLKPNTNTELNPKKTYRLIILAYKKTKTPLTEKSHDESWVIDFLPEDPTPKKVKISPPAS
jgi:hypothetical protein